jgi:hypothetical protein
VLVDEIERALGVSDRRFDLAAMADDPRVGEEARHVARAVPRDLRGIEAEKRAAGTLRAS